MITFDRLTKEEAKAAILNTRKEWLIDLSREFSDTSDEGILDIIQDITKSDKSLVSWLEDQEDVTPYLGFDDKEKKLADWKNRTKALKEADEYYRKYQELYREKYGEDLRVRVVIVRHDSLGYPLEMPDYVMHDYNKRSFSHSAWQDEETFAVIGEEEPEAEAAE